MSHTSRLHRWQARCRRFLTGIVTPQDCRDLALGLLLAGSAGTLAYLTHQLPPGTAVLLWVLWALSALLIVGLGWLRLFGPLLFYELVSLGRRRRHALTRTAYALALLLLLTALYAYWTWKLPAQQQLSTQQLTKFAEAFFFTFMCAEFLAVLMLTPPFTAGAIAGEKDRQTLEFLLATDLYKREIVLSKLAARLTNLAMLLLVGLPVLSFTQFFGGIDPDLVLIGFGVLALTMLSLGAVSILHSVYAQKSRTAIVLAYLTAAIYLGLGWLADTYVPDAPAFAHSGPQVSWQGNDYQVTVMDLVDAFNAGNIVVALRKLADAWRQNAALAPLVPGIMARYAAFHGFTALVCMLWAVGRLRAAAILPASVPRRRPSRVPRFWHWPRVENDHLLWKELVVEPRLHLQRTARLLVVALACGSLIPALGSWWNCRIEHTIDLKTMQQEIQDWIKTVGTLVACFTLVMVAIRAAGIVSSERDRQTLDSLLTTPLNRDSILYSKWLACILSARWTWLWLGLIWGIGVATASLSVYALPLLVWAWIVYAMFAANLGLWFSTWCGSTLRATVATLLTLLGVSFGHWLLLGCYVPFFLYSSGQQQDFPGWIMTFQKFALTPPLTWTALVFQLAELQNSISNETFREGKGLGQLIAAVAGIVVFGLASGFLWRLALGRFRALGLAQPLHQGVFPGSDNPFAEPVTVEAEPVVVGELVSGPSDAAPAAAVPVALPAGNEAPALRGAVLLEEERGDGPAQEAS